MHLFSLKAVSCLTAMKISEESLTPLWCTRSALRVEQMMGTFLGGEMMWLQIWRCLEDLEWVGLGLCRVMLSVWEIWTPVTADGASRWLCSSLRRLVDQHWQLMCFWLSVMLGIGLLVIILHLLLQVGALKTLQSFFFYSVEK